METSVEGGSISIFLNRKLVDFHIGDKSVSGAEDLLPKISELLKKNELSRSDVETIAVSNGPGSFTGIRIGIATALALQKSLNCKCYGVDLVHSMAIFAGVETKTENIITAVSHGRNKICWFHFNRANLNVSDSSNNYVVSDTSFLCEHIAEEITNKNKLIVYADSYLYNTLIEKKATISSAELKIINAGGNLSLIVGNTVLEGKLSLEKPKPLYINESNSHT